MKAEFTAIIELAPEGGFWAICPEVPGANGQGETIEETKVNLRQAIELIPTLTVKKIIISYHSELQTQIKFVPLHFHFL